MSKQVVFISTGGTITCGEAANGKLEPILEADDLMNLAIKAGFVDRVAFRFESPYKIDSQLFNFDEHGGQILQLLESIPPTEDIVITTGTDTINWLSALVRNHEQSLGFPRKVVILSSMHAPIDEKSQLHVGNIMRSGLELLLEKVVLKMVFMLLQQKMKQRKKLIFSVFIILKVWQNVQVSIQLKLWEMNGMRQVV